MRHERVVAYTPATNYLGPDYLTYIIYDGLQVQQHISWTGQQDSVNQVTMHVRNCRKVATTLLNKAVTAPHPMCVCADTEITMVNNTVHCYSALVSICSDASTRKDFLNPCLACTTSVETTTAISLTESTTTITSAMQSPITGECIAQIGRAVSMLSSIGLCSTSPPKDCSGELVTAPGSEIFNYLSLSPPVLEKSFSLLGNGVGAVGWYKSAPPST
jgi:hypothetical protein